VAKAFLAWQDLDKATEVLNRSHSALIQLARFNFTSHVTNVIAACLGFLGIKATDIDQAGIVDRNLDAIVSL
jgi:hypothetical protein